MFRYCLVLDTMRISTQLLVPRSTAIMLSAAITAILLASNLTTMANGQELQQASNQTASIGNGTLFQSEEDNFRIQVPEGWAIIDLNNTDATLDTEATQGYGILAQLCQEDQQQTAPDIRAN